MIESILPKSRVHQTQIKILGFGFASHFVTREEFESREILQFSEILKSNRQSTQHQTAKYFSEYPMLELHFQDDQNEIRHPTKILFWDTTNILFVETPGVERAAEEREENWIKSNRQAISQKRKKNNQDVKLIEVVHRGAFFA